MLALSSSPEFVPVRLVTAVALVPLAPANVAS